MVTVTTPALGDFGWTVVWIGLCSIHSFISAAYELQKNKWPVLEPGMHSVGRVLQALSFCI